MRRVLFTTVIWLAAFVKGWGAPTVGNEFPFKIREGLLWIEVAIPQSEKPLNFLVDTGAGASVINLSTSKRLGMKLGRKVNVRGVHSTFAGQWQERMAAKAGGVELPRNYLAVDLESLSGSCETPVDGLLGMDFFCGRVVQIDFESERIRLLKPEAGRSSDEFIPLQLRQCGMRVPICVNGGNRCWVRLDTGCGGALQWVTSNVNPDQCSRRVAIGLLEISVPETETTVNIGSHRFEKVLTGLHEKAIFPGEAGLLGTALLSRFSSITLNARAGRLILKPRQVLK